MEISNLASKSVSAPRSADKKEHQNLSTHSVYKLKDVGLNEVQKEQKLVVQAVTVKLIDENPKFKAQITLSDGVASILAILTGAVFDKLVSSYFISNSFLQTKIPKTFDVVLVERFKLVELKGSKIMVILDPVTVLKENVGSKIGNPVSFKKVQENETEVDLNQDTAIPTPA